jgi:hypothetical protein
VQRESAWFSSSSLLQAFHRHVSFRQRSRGGDKSRGILSEYSLVVDLDQLAVFEFWFENSGTGAHSPLPIIKADANGVYFESRRNDNLTDKHIVGVVDRITGAVNADDFTIFSNGDMQRQNWDFDCKPANPLF